MTRQHRLAVLGVVATLPLLMALGALGLHCEAGVCWRTLLEVIGFCVGLPAVLAAAGAGAAVR